MSERFRTNPRLMLDRPAILIDGPTKLKVGVLVIDLSMTGVSVELPPDVKLPKSFQIQWEPVSGLPHLVIKGELMWQKGVRAGVRFLELGPKTHAVLESFLRLRFGE